MREIRSSGSVEGVMRNHDPYSDCLEGAGDPGLRAPRLAFVSVPMAFKGKKTKSRRET
jgi:hypothetical protein